MVIPVGGGSVPGGLSAVGIKKPPTNPAQAKKTINTTRMVFFLPRGRQPFFL